MAHVGFPRLDHVFEVEGQAPPPSMNEFIRRAQQISEGILANKEIFSQYQGEYAVLKGLPEFQSGNLSGPCTDLLGRVEGLARKREIDEQELNRLRTQWIVWLSKNYRPAQATPGHIERFDQLTQTKDGLDEVLMPDSCPDCWALGCKTHDGPQTIACCFPCALVFWLPCALVCNKEILGKRKIDWLASDIKKGIRNG